MKITKILLAASAIAMSASAFASTGGFYVGLNAGASMSKTTAKAAKINDVDFGKIKISKTRAIVEGVLGYDVRFDSFVFGGDVEFGTAFGKGKKDIKSAEFTGPQCKNEEGKLVPVDASAAPTAANQKKFTTNAVSTAKITAKNQWRLGFMPRVGYLICPDSELYLTAGVRVINNKFTATNRNVALSVDQVYTATDSSGLSWGEPAEITNDADKSLTGNITPQNISKKKTKVAPVIGLGVKYDINSDVFIKAEYTYMFKTNFAPKGMPKFKYDEHALKLGIGYRF